jgi:hypothetical protein
MRERGEDMAHYIHTHVHETTRERFIVIEHGENGTSLRSLPRLNSAHFLYVNYGNVRQYIQS